MVEKLPHRPSRFKLAYVENASNKDKLGFGIESCKKGKNYHKKTEDKFLESLCIHNYVHFHDLHIFKETGKWQPVAMPSITSVFNGIYEKVKMAPETCPRGKKHNIKSNNNFW